MEQSVVLGQVVAEMLLQAGDAAGTTPSSGFCLQPCLPPSPAWLQNVGEEAEQKAGGARWEKAEATTSNTTALVGAT